MYWGCGRVGDFTGNPWLTVQKPVIWVCSSEPYDTLWATWMIAPSLAKATYQYVLYIDGTLVDHNSPNIINMLVPHGYIPAIGVIAVPPIVNAVSPQVCNCNPACPCNYDPACCQRPAPQNTTCYNNINVLYTDLISPIRADLKVLKKKIRLFYEYTYGYYNHVLINGVLVDNNGIPGKEYPVNVEAWADPTPPSEMLDGISAHTDNFGLSIAIVPLPFISPIVSSELDIGTFDTTTDVQREHNIFANCTLINMFKDLVCTDIQLYNFNFQAYAPPAQEYILGKLRNNFVSFTDNQKGITIRDHYRMNIAPRQAIVNGQLVTKPAKHNQLVLRLQDYRYIIQFDKQQFYSISQPNRFPAKLPCQSYRFVAQPNAIQADLESGKYAVCQLSRPCPSHPH